MPHLMLRGINFESTNINLRLPLFVDYGPQLVFEVFHFRCKMVERVLQGHKVAPK